MNYRYRVGYIGSTGVIAVRYVEAENARTAEGHIYELDPDATITDVMKVYT